jgi:hypothetical protein
MAEVTSIPFERSHRLRFDWLVSALFRPRRTFTEIAAQPQGVWLTPLLVLSATGLIHAIVAGVFKQAAAQSGGMSLPPGFEYYTPEQQAQFQQAMAATSGPVFVYVFPAILSILGVWVGWLIVSGLLHLIFTLLGGRSSTSLASNLVAWGGLPLALRDGVRIVAMLVSRQLITHPGLSGFAPADDGGLSIYLTQLLGLIDLYVIWHLVLLAIGARAGTGLAPLKAWAGPLITLLVVLLLQALFGFLAVQLGNLNTIRPFLF